MAFQRTAMRIGVIQSGRLVEERLVTGDSVSVGRTARSTVILPTEGLPPRWRLFQRRGGRYHLRLAPTMEGRVASGGRVLQLPAEGDRSLLLPERARGRIAVGDAVILFQIVQPPQLPRPQLPPSLRGSPTRDLDRPFVALALLSLIAHLAMVLYLRGVDWPRTPNVEEVPDVFITRVLRLPAPPPPAPVVVAEVKPAPARKPVAPARPRPSIAAQREKLVAQVGRKGLLQVLTALGEQGAARDLLRNGSVDRLQEEAMRGVGGLSVAQEGQPLPLATGGPGGRIADVSALQGGPRISTADVGGRGAERRAPIVRSEPPALDEPVEGFDPQRLTRAIRDHMAAIRACYERALKRHPEISGRLVLRFTLTPAGTVAAVEVDEDTLRDPDVTACVTNAVRSWRFPAPPRKVEVSFPFVFQPAS